MAKTDTLTRFLIDGTQARGALVSLDRSWADIRGRSTRLTISQRCPIAWALSSSALRLPIARQ